MTKKKKQSWKIGDYFLAPLADKSFSVGQIIGQVKEALNSVICIFFDSKINSPEIAKKSLSDLSEEKVISVLFTTRDLLDSGDWQIFYSADPVGLHKFINLNCSNYMIHL